MEDLIAQYDALYVEIDAELKLYSAAANANKAAEAQRHMDRCDELTAQARGVLKQITAWRPVAA